MSRAAVSSLSARWDLPAGPEAAARARALIRARLTSWGLPPGGFADDVVLAASELATNAAVHGAPPLGLSLRLDRRGLTWVLTCRVSDASPVLPRPCPARQGAGHGYGLPLVAALTSQWGARNAGHGKQVWFELPAPAPRQPSPPPGQQRCRSRLLAAGGGAR